jgi:hypothetical protein
VTFRMLIAGIVEGWGATIYTIQMLLTDADHVVVSQRVYKMDRPMARVVRFR